MLKGFGSGVKFNWNEVGSRATFLPDGGGDCSLDDEDRGGVVAVVVVLGRGEIIGRRPCGRRVRA